MKKTLLLSILALLGMSQVAAQEYEYVPLVREGVKWIYYYVNSDEIYPPDPNLAIGTVYLTLELKGDTIINGKTYKVMHKYHGSSINVNSDTIPICLREEDKIVYGIVPEGKTYHDCPISCYGNEMVYSQIINGDEFILYDFNDPVAFGYNNSYFFQYYDEMGINPYKFDDIVIINEHKAKRYVFSCSGDFCFIEGIGFDGLTDGYLLAYKYSRFWSDPIFCLSHVVENGQIIYRSARSINNDTTDVYLPIARPDVQWVNEHVTICNGDTTRYYYTYRFELVGNNSLDYNCYYSSQDELSPYTDSIVSQGSETMYKFFCKQNKMLEPFQENGSNMINFDCTNTMDHVYILYQFDQSDISSFCLLNYYIDYQEGDWLNRENFVQLEPLTIEGVSCSRYAYINEQGDTAAYVVEGIGFDSRDMGDLLTPFTRKPDPNADYQEWCGLSHVIKDGKIIYKGMRFNPNAVVIPGDVDGDGEITISDANSVIDIVVMGGNAGHTHSPAADANGDGEVTIADVNAIVNLIQGD